MIAAALQSVVRMTDAAVARMYLALFQEHNSLLAFLFHSLFRDESEIAQNRVDPLERTTVDQFRQLIEYYLAHGYQFIGPDDLLRGLGPEGKYALLTFDDGYFNNSLALPILEKYRVPAMFFISTDHIRENKCFWWDVLYRERAAQGVPPAEIHRETISLKHLRTDQIEAKLVSQFGENALTPRGDIDRPFTPAELRQFAASPYVYLGNHTADHAILTNYSPEQVCQQIRAAQESLRDMAGVESNSIAYPNGAHSESILTACSQIGLKIGFTIRPHKNILPLDVHSPNLLSLGRFVPHADATIASQCRTYRSDFLLYARFRDWYLRLARGHTAESSS